MTLPTSRPHPEVPLQGGEFVGEADKQIDLVGKNEDNAPNTGIAELAL
jgi:hypothetical protein